MLDWLQIRLLPPLRRADFLIANSKKPGDFSPGFRKRPPLAG
jgi:hypothetical protein